MGNQPEIYIKLDGNVVSLNECSWITTAPCGCVCGWASTRTQDAPLATEQAMFAEYEVPKWRQKQDREQGFIHSLVLSTEAYPTMRGTCTHEPKWGVEPVPTPEGMSWGYKKGTCSFHLVPSDAVYSLDVELKGVVKDAKSLCGVEYYAWGDRRWEDKPYCKRCILKVKKMNTTGEQKSRSHHRKKIEAS